MVDPGKPSERFLNLPEDKRQAIISAATREFADEGFEYGKTTVIALAAGVSVGSLYQYFPTKQDLFLYVVYGVAEVLREQVEQLVALEGSVVDRLRAVLVMVQETSSQSRQAEVQLYHELTAAGNRDLVRQVAEKLESYTSQAWITLVEEGQASGEIRTDIPAPMLAFLIDDLFIALQYAYACDYYMHRFAIYLGDTATNDEAIVEQVMAFLTGALRSQP